MKIKIYDKSSIKVQYPCSDCRENSILIKKLTAIKIVFVTYLIENCRSWTMSINAVNSSSECLSSPLISSLEPIPLKQSIGRDNKQQLQHSLTPSLTKRKSLKDAFKNIRLEELSQDRGYRIYSIIFDQVLILLMILGLWAPSNSHWLLRNVYPMFIYFVILYPWTTFITQESYWSIPVFLFINLHLSGIFAYRSARSYWKSTETMK